MEMLLEAYFMTVDNTHNRLQVRPAWARGRAMDCEVGGRKTGRLIHCMCASQRPPPDPQPTGPCTPHPQTLNEYIEDTEDLVNLKLDQHRNQVGPA